MKLRADLATIRYEIMAAFPLEIRDETAHSDVLPVNVPRSQFRILLVDDEILGTTTRTEILREHGYSVDFFHSPLTALRSDFSVFQLAIVDFQMPELNCKELLLRMRASGAKFPIALLTGSVEALSNEDHVLFARCIDKGTPISILLDAIAEFLHKRGSRL